MLGWLLRGLVLLLIVRAVWRFLAGLLDGLATAPSSRGAASTAGVELVRDPVCGTYVVPARAVTSGGGTSVQYFCSERCRDAYAAGRRLAS
jgi:uncharacterized protein